MSAKNKKKRRFVRKSETWFNSSNKHCMCRPLWHKLASRFVGKEQKMCFWWHVEVLWTQPAYKARQYYLDDLAVEWTRLLSEMYIFMFRKFVKRSKRIDNRKCSSVSLESIPKVPRLQLKTVLQISKATGCDDQLVLFPNFEQKKKNRT